MVTTIACGVSGYLMFGSDLALPGRSNVLTAPSLAHSNWAQLAYITAMLAAVLAYPMNLQSLVNSLESILLHATPRRVSLALRSIPTDHRRDGLTAVCISLSLVLAATCADSLGLLNSVNGAINGCLIAFVLPSIMYLKCAAKDSPKHCLARWLSW